MRQHLHAVNGGDFPVILNHREIMSSVSSPTHRFTGDYGNLYDPSSYDPNFTVDISTKMRVPTKIVVANDNKEEIPSDGLPSIPKQLMVKENSNVMQVPERIIVAGQEHHFGVKAPPRELRLEENFMPKRDIIRVETPPRTLTLEDHFFPTVDSSEIEEAKEAPEKKIHFSLPENQSIVPQTPTTADSDSLQSPSEEILTMKHHMSRLSRRVVILENENQQRQQREMIMYSLSVAYFVLKAIIWLHRHW